MHGHQHRHFRPCDGARGAAAPPQPPPQLPQLPSQLSQQRPPPPQQFPPFFPPNTNAYAFLQNPAFSNPSFNAYHQNPNFPHQKLTNNYAAPPKPKYSIERIDQAAVKAHRDLLAAGEFVSAWKVSQSALLSLQVDSWSSLGFSMQQIPSLYRLMLIEGKVSAFIHCFVGVRKITSVYELGAEICKNEGVEQFEELELGPLLRHPLVVHYFSVPSEVKEVVKITSAELISYLAEFMDCHKRKHIRAEELLDFIASKESVSVRENLGIRIQSLGMHIHSIQEARKSEASTLNNYSCRVRHVSGTQTRKVEGDLSLHPPIILQKKALNRRFEVLSQRIKSFSPINGGSKHIRFVSSSSDDKSDDDSEDSKDGNVINSQSKISLQIEKNCDTRPSSCPYPSATEEMVRLGLKNDMVAQPSPSSGGLKCNESKRSSGKKRKLESQNSDSPLLGKLCRRDKDELDIDILQPENDVVKSESAEGKSACKSLVKDDNLGLCRQTMETFITTWKEACRTHSVAEVFERMLHFYSTSPRRKKRVRSMFSLFPCIGLLHVAVTSIKCGMWDSLYDTLQTIGEDITPIASPAEHEKVIVEPSSEKDALSVEEHSSQPECSTTVDDIIKKVTEYFELDTAISREGKSVLEKQFMCLKKLHDCETWLTKQFSVKDFASFGFGEFFRFIEDHPFLLPNNFSEISSGEVNTKFPVEVSMLQNQLGILVSQAASNLWEGGIITKQHISELLKHQFPLVSFQVNVNETSEVLSEFLKDKKDSDSSSCILFSGTLGTPYTWNPVVPGKNFLVDSSGVKTDSGHRVGTLGSLSAKDAVECLLKAPMLSDLQSWAHWDCIFAPSLGPLLEWLSTEACIKELLCLVTKDGKIIRIDRSATVEQFLEALLKGSSFQTAVKLLSLFSLYGGKQYAPLSLLKFHARRAMEVILKNSIDSKGVKKSSDLSDRSKDLLRVQILNEEITANLLAVGYMESRDPSENQFSISEAVSVASRFILDCLGHLPSEFRSFAADILLSGLRSFTKDAPLAMLRECSQICHRLMLHDIGLSLNISEWIADYHVFNSTTATDLLVCPDASRSGAASTGLSLDTKLIPDEVKPLASEGKMIASVETDEHVVLCGELQREEDLDELSIENCSGGCTRVVLKNAEDQDATLIIESIRRDEFGLIPTLTNAESSMLSKQHARLGRALHCLSQELYSQDSHFLLELVQNADDNFYLKNVEPTLVFILQSTGIIVLNNEQGFSAQNIRALCDVGNSTKRGASTGYIGRKGIGFKSVFRVTDAPEIHSNGFHVKFDISEGQIGFVLPTVVTPCDLDFFGRLVPGEASQVDATCWNTCIVLPFKPKLREENGMSTIMSMFSDLHPSLLLFLHRLRSIKFKNMLNGSSIVMRRETVGDGIVKVSHGEEKMNWFVATQELMASPIRPDVQTTEIAIAFTLKESSNGEYRPHLDQQPVFAFLPLRTYGLKFILQGDFVLPSSREEVDGDSAWNQWLLSEFPGLFVSAQRSFCALSCFQERPGKAVTAYMSFVPLIGEVHGFFSHLPRMIISKLRTSNCMLLEGHDKEWVPPCRVLRGWDEQARVLLPETLLHEHLGLGYLDKDVILSDHLAKALGVHDYGPKILIDIMSSICHTANGVKSLGLDWLSCWLNTLYVMLVPAAWKTSVNALAESDLNKSLKNVPFIPLSDGSYGSVAEGTIWLPCDVFSSRNDPEHCLEAFPNLYAKLRTVSAALLLAAAGTTNSVEEMPVDNLIRMLHRIGVQRLSAHQIVKMHILPAISDGKITDKDKNLMVEYLSFIMVHLQSSCTSCFMEREQIISELQNKAFILTNHGYKRPAEVSIHFCREFGNPVDMNKLMDAADFEWHEVDIIYLKHSSTKSVSSGLTKWRDFFQELGVSNFVQIIQVEKNVADVSQSVLRDIMSNGDLIIPGSIAKDWESPELVNILSSLSHQNDREKSKYLLEVLDKMWDDCFSAKVAGCCISRSPVQDIKSFKSSFVKSIIDFQWISSSMDQMLHYPKDLFFDCEEVRSILGNFAPYAIPQVRSRKFICDIGFKTLVTLDDALQILQMWRRSKTPFEASIAQMSKLYAFIWDGVNTSKEKIVEVFRSGPSVFVPFADVSRHDDVVSGKFLSPSEVYWHDPTGSMDQTKKLLLQCGSVNEINCPLSKTLAHVYQGLHNFFVDECGVHEIPPFRSYFQILVQLSSIVLPSQAANAVLRVFLKWAEDLKSGLAEQEDIIYLKECLLKLDIAVLPTVQDKWVSLHPTFGLVCWCDDEDLKKEFMDSENLNFLYFGDLSKKEKEMLPAKIAELMQTLGIPSLSQVITREAIFYGIEDCRDKASLVNWVLPYAQRYICKLHPDVYFQLKYSGVGNLSSLQVVVVEKLFYRHTIKGCDSASKKRSESSCLLQENILYITRASDSHSIFLELSRLFFKGTPDLHLANFLHMITTMGESGSTKEQMEFFIVNNQKVPQLPDDEPAWLLSSLLPQQLEDQMPQTTSASTSIDEQNLLKSKKKPGSSPNWPPVDWKTAPDFSFARENRTRTRPGSAPPNGSLKEEDRVEGFIPNREDQNVSASIGVDWIIQEDLVNNSDAVALPDYKAMEDQNLLVESGSPVFGMVGGSLEELKSISRIDERDQLSFGTPNENQAVVTGRMGEFVAFQYFTDKVGATSVTWVNKEVETGLPYDIVIGEKGECKEYVEVKATKSLKKDWFTISTREWQFAAEKGESFSIAHVALLGQKNAKVTVFKNPLKLCQQGVLHLAVLMRHHPKELAFAPYQSRT